jgi:multidrug efflux pump subunit AcrB
MNNLIAYFTRQSTVVAVVTVFVFVAGMMSVRRIKREVFPSVNFDIITVTTVYPGAAADSVERLVTNPLELALQEVDGIKKMMSTSTENMSAIVLQLDPDQADVEKSKSDIQDVIDRTLSDLPTDAEDPVVTKIEGKQIPVIKVGLTGKLTEGELRTQAKSIERQLESLPDVARVDYDSWRDLEIHVEADPKKLAAYQVTLTDIVRAIAGRNISIPGGTLEASQSTAGSANSPKELIVRTVGDYENNEDVAKTVIRANSITRPIYVSDVATVKQTLSREKARIFVNGEPGIVMTVMKKESGDAIDLVDSVRATMEELQPKLDPSMKVTYLEDSAFWVKRRISVLSSNFIAGLTLVLIVLSLFLPIKVALVTALGIPFSFLLTFIVFNLWGVSLNLLSLMGLIIVLGMLIDDAIVVMENCQRYIEQGVDHVEAAIKGTQEVWAPVAGSVLTTVAAFGPLMFMSGIFGKFVFNIPLGVVLALMFSLFECYFILPNHIAMWTRPAKAGSFLAKVSPHLYVDRIWKKTAQPAYERVATAIIHRRYISAFLALLFVIATGVLAAKKMNFVLFPIGDIENFFVRVDAPVGTSLDQMTQIMQPVTEAAMSLPENEIQSVSTRIGQQHEGGFEPMRRGSHLAQLMINLTDQSKRSRNAQEVMDALREKVGDVPGSTRITYSLQRSGPPVGKPVSVGVRGQNYEDILPAVEDIKAKLKEFNGVTDISDTFIPGKDELHVKVKEAESSATRLTNTDIGSAVRAAYEGVEATKIRKLDEEVTVRVTLEPKYRASAETLGNLELPNQTGNVIRLDRVADIERKSGISVYEHEQTLRQVSVNAEIEEGVTTSQVANAQLIEYVASIKEKYPKVSFKFGGEGEDTQESFATLGETFLIAMLGVFLLLVVLFGNIIQPIAVVAVIPFGICAVIWTFFLHGRPLSFLSMIGTIALAGVIINNAIVLIDFVNQMRAQGHDRFKSIQIAASTRLRPIFLTSVTTVLGLLPTAYGIGGSDPFVVPIALALGWGVGIGSLISVAFFPAIIAIFDDFIIITDKIKAKIFG